MIRDCRSGPADRTLVDLRLTISVARPKTPIAAVNRICQNSTALKSGGLELCGL